MVVGGGWAGLAAATALQRAGWQVTVLEATARLGGRAFSFWDAETAMWLDNGQHVLLGACEQVVHWLDSLGLEEAVHFQPVLDLPTWADGKWASLAGSRWPGSLHLLPGLLSYRHLTLPQRLRALSAASRILKGHPSPASTFAEWLVERGQDAATRRRLWEMMEVAILNCSPEAADAGLALKALSLVLEQGWKGARLGFFRLPLGQLADQVGDWLREHGVAIRLRTPVRALAVEGGRVVGVQPAGQPRISADGVVLAIPWDRAFPLVPEPVRDPSWPAPSQLSWSPIWNLYLWYDRPVLDQPVVAFPDGISQFVFERGQLLGLDTWKGRHLAVSLSAADTVADRPRTQLLAEIQAELGEALPRLAGARLQRWRWVLQPRATFRATPEAVTRRPPPWTGVEGLARAGDWTDTGWPACLEGAVGSGFSAARVLSEGSACPTAGTSSS